MGGSIVEQLISVIVPIYNVEKYLYRCLESINNQTYNNIEVILVDDGSTDSSGVIADQYAEKHNRFCVLHKENGGLSDARNNGLERARGTYICFIDSDDVIHNDYIRVLYNAIIENDCDIAECDFEYVDEKKINEINHSGNVLNSTLHIYSNIDMLHRLYNSTYVRTVVAWNKLYKKELFNDIVFPVGRIHEDEATTYKLYYKASKVAVLSDKLYFYYQNVNSIMQKQYNVKRLDVLIALEERRTFLKKEKLSDLFYEDTHKYLMKILYHYSQVKKLDNFDNKKELLKELKYKYKNAYKECENAPWSLKRRVKLKMFGMLPSMYSLM